MKKKIIVLNIILILTGLKADIPCASRSIDGNPERLICVCNGTYCDTITRVEPPPDSFITYTSSKAGSRFLKGIGKIVDAVDITEGTYGKVIKLTPGKRYQTIKGFGAAATDATGINWRKLSESAQDLLIKSYFSRDGLEYNIIRVPIASCDFSERPYYYNEYPVNDKGLTNFTYTKEDTEYKIPLILKAFEAATDKVLVFASLWSPPTWMKVTDSQSSQTRLKDEFYQTLADYFCKFIKLYKAVGIWIWGATPTNEPVDGSMMTISFGPKDTLGWTTKGMRKWLVENFGPTLKTCTETPVEIMALDDQRSMLPLWKSMILDSETLNYVDGIAIHGYTDPFVPGSIVDLNMRDIPNKYVMSTEFCIVADGVPVILGSWERAEIYTVTILDNLVNNYVGFVDWNMALNPEGGPNWANNFVDAPVIVNATSDEFYKQPMFYAMGHVSKWVPRGSQRIGTVRLSPINYTADDKNIYSTTPDRKHIYDHVAFVTPKNTIVAIIANYEEAQIAALLIGSKQVTVSLEAHSIVTVEFPNTF